MSTIKKQMELIEALPNVSIFGTRTSPIKRVAAYCRVSTAHEEQLGSLHAQVDEYTKKITSNPSWTIANIYADEGKSGTSTIRRTELNRLIRDCSEDKIDYVMTKSISRLARNVLDSIEIVRKLKGFGVEMYFEKENMSSFDSKSEMVFTILASVAQDESRNISENSTWGIRKRMRDGVPIVNHNRFLGYTKDANGELIIDEEQAKTVRYIFNRYLEGVGYTRIARELEEKGVLTGAGKSHWHGSTIRDILSNEKYYGELLLQKTYTVDYLTHERRDNKRQLDQYRFSNNHQPIVSKEVWLAVKQKREEKFFLTSGKDKNREKYSFKYAFSGRLVCKKCGATLKRRTLNANTPSARIVWQCNDYINKGKRACDSKAVGDLTLKRAFIEFYNSEILNTTDFFELLAKTTERVLLKNSNKKKYTKLCKELSELEVKLGKLFDMKMDDLISTGDYKSQYDMLSKQRDKLLAKKDELSNGEITELESQRKLALIRETINCNSTPLVEFDDDLFKTIVSKVIIINPIQFKFVLIDGAEFLIDATKHNDGRKYKNRDY